MRSFVNSSASCPETAAVPDSWPAGEDGEQVEPKAQNGTSLRAWQLEDAPFLLELDSLPEMLRYLGPGVQSRSSLAEAEASILRRRAATRDGYGIWAVVDQASGQLAGNLLFKPFDSSKSPAREAEIGWHIHPAFQGRGHAGRAALAALAHGQAAGISRVHALVEPANQASVRVCQKLGFEVLESGQWFEGRPVIHYILELQGCVAKLIAS